MAEVTIRVINLVTGDPIQNAYCAFASAYGGYPVYYSDITGYIRDKQFIEGEWSVTITAAGFQPFTSYFLVPEDTYGGTLLMQLIPEPTIEKEYRLYIKVIDAKYGAPVVSAYVNGSGIFPSTTTIAEGQTDGGGEVYWWNVPPESLEITVTHPGFETRSIVVHPQDAACVGDVCRTDQTITLQELGTELTVEVQGTGSATPTGEIQWLHDNVYAVAPDSTVTMTANENNPAWEFDHWELYNVASPDSLTAKIISIEPTENCTVKAVFIAFIPITVQIEVYKPLLREKGGTTIPPEGIYPEDPAGYMAGESVNVQAISNTGYEFDYWTTQGVTLSDVSVSNITIYPTVPATRLVARFKPSASPLARLSVSTQGLGITDFDGETDLPLGTQVTITATPGEGYELSLWVKNYANHPAISNQLTFTLDEDTIIVAIFQEISNTGPFNVGVTMINTMGDELIQVQGASETSPGIYVVDEPSSIILTANKPANWTANGSPVGLNKTSIAVYVQQNMSIIADFSTDQPIPKDLGLYAIIGASVLGIYLLAKKK